jgi:hypothetical protein
MTVATMNMFFRIAPTSLLEMRRQPFGRSPFNPSSDPGARVRSTIAAIRRRRPNPPLAANRLIAPEPARTRTRRSRPTD